MTAAPEVDPEAQPEGIIKDESIRLADLGLIHQRLLNDRARRLDVVVSRRMIEYDGGRLLVRAGDSTQIVSDDGVTSAAGVYRPTVTFAETMGKMLGVDVGYLKKLYEENPTRTDIIDAMVNGRLHGDVRGLREATEDAMDGGDFAPEFAPHRGNMLLRLLKPAGDQDGVVRAMLSPQFRLDMDNFDVATAVMEGIAASGKNVIADTCSLTDRKMTLRFVVPSVAALAPNLLAGYHSPLDGPGGTPRAGADRPGMKLRVESNWGRWTVPSALAAAAREGMGYDEGQWPVVFAGFIVTNGDFGGSARTIFPQIRIKICKNGLTLMVSGDRRVHLGSKQSEGVVEYAADTMQKELELISKQTRDAVKTYLDEGWFTTQVQEIEALAGTKLGGSEAEAQQVIKQVTMEHKFTKGEAEGVWGMFVRGGGNPVAGSVANAVSAYSQTIADADRAAEMDAKAVPMMQRAAELARA